MWNLMWMTMNFGLHDFDLDVNYAVAAPDDCDHVDRPY